MYGGLELAEVIRCAGFDAIIAVDRNPYMPLRGVKFNCPLDERTPTYHNHHGHSHRNNVLVMWDMAFWKGYIDELVRFRYNYLSLWSLHPFSSMVRVPGYEKVALDDVQSTAGTLKMTLDDKIAFWRRVMRYGKDHNVDIYVVTWNIFVLGTDGQYGLTDKCDNATTTPSQLIFSAPWPLSEAQPPPSIRYRLPTTEGNIICDCKPGSKSSLHAIRCSSAG